MPINPLIRFTSRLRESQRALNRQLSEIAERCQMSDQQLSAMDEQARAAQQIATTLEVGLGAIRMSGFQNPGFNGDVRIRSVPILGRGNFSTWIRGLKMEIEIKRFNYLMDRKKNAPDKLEFRRKVGILNWMEVVKDYNGDDELPY